MKLRRVRNVTVPSAEDGVGVVSVDAWLLRGARVPTRSILVLRHVLEHSFECWKKSSSPESMIFLQDRKAQSRSEGVTEPLVRRENKHFSARFLYLINQDLNTSSVLPQSVRCFCSESDRTVFYIESQVKTTSFLY